MSVPLVEQNLFFLRQGAELVTRLSDDIYAPNEVDGPRRSGIGPHLRHCLDFYACFLRDFEGGRIDYDERVRSGDIETDRQVALDEMEAMVEGLSEVASRDLDEAVEVRNDLAPGEEPAKAWNASTLGRELRFLASHTVHHFALIALLLRQMGVEPGDEFGVAPATVAHWRDGEPCAR